MKTVLLTGANGLLGSHLARELLQRNYAVRAFIRKDSDLQTLAGLPLDRWEGDLRDASNVLAATYGCDYVIHAGAATQINPARSQMIWDVNLTGTEHIIQAAQQVGVKRLVYVGIADLFKSGSKEHPGDETQLHEGSPYALDYIASKQAATQRVNDAVKKHRLSALSVHPTFMLGGLDSKLVVRFDKPTSNLMLLELYNKRMAGGKNYVYVGDVATAIVNALNQGRPGESYILGNENLSYQEALALMAQMMQVAPPRFQIPARLATLYGQLSDFKTRITGSSALVNGTMMQLVVGSHYYSPEKARRELALPQTPISHAIEEAIDWFRQLGYIT